MITHTYTHKCVTMREAYVHVRATFTLRDNGHLLNEALVEMATLCSDVMQQLIGEPKMAPQKMKRYLVGFRVIRVQIVLTHVAHVQRHLCVSTLKHTLF